MNGNIGGMNGLSRYYVDGEHLIESTEQLEHKEVTKAEFDFLVEKSRAESQARVDAAMAVGKAEQDARRAKVASVLEHLGLTVEDFKGLI